MPLLLWKGEQQELGAGSSEWAGYGTGRDFSCPAPG